MRLEEVGLALLEEGIGNGSRSLAVRLCVQVRADRLFV